jgi:hypothetical protein
MILPSFSRDLKRKFSSSIVYKQHDPTKNTTNIAQSIEPIREQIVMRMVVAVICL